MTKERQKIQKKGMRTPNIVRASWVANINSCKRLFGLAGVTLVVLGALAFGLISAIRVAPSEVKASVQLYKNPQCSCCEGYANYLRDHGYGVTTTPTHNLSLIRREHGVPEKLAGCHTMIIGGYVVEGHVPVHAIDRLLSEHPNIKGISLPGMPEGSPGMTGRKSEPFTIYEISDEAKVYAVE
jgi:hypothetical protein